MPVVFSDSLSQSERELFIDLCDEWSSIANVRCVIGPQAGRLHLFLDNKANGGCNTTVGEVVNARMNMPNCFNWYQLIHEIGHPFGLMHEHQRSNRDDYININTSYAIPSYVYAFDKLGSSRYQTNYDFQSVMHYPPNSYSVDPYQNFITMKPGFEQHANVIGNYNRISDGDADTMVSIYGRPVANASSKNIGVFVKSSSGEAISNAIVTIALKTLMTDVSGYVNFGQLPMQMYSIQVSIARIPK